MTSVFFFNNHFAIAGRGLTGVTAIGEALDAETEAKFHSCGFAIISIPEPPSKPAVGLKRKDRGHKGDQVKVGLIIEINGKGYELFGPTVIHKTVSNKLKSAEDNQALGFDTAGGLRFFIVDGATNIKYHLLIYSEFAVKAIGYRPEDSMVIFCCGIKYAIHLFSDQPQSIDRPTIISIDSIDGEKRQKVTVIGVSRQNLAGVPLTIKDDEKKLHHTIFTLPLQTIPNPNYSSIINLAGLDKDYEQKWKDDHPNPNKKAKKQAKKKQVKENEMVIDGDNQDEKDDDNDGEENQMVIENDNQDKKNDDDDGDSAFAIYSDFNGAKKSSMAGVLREGLMEKTTQVKTTQIERSTSNDDPNKGGKPDSLPVSPLTESLLATGINYPFVFFPLPIKENNNNIGLAGLPLPSTNPVPLVDQTISNASFDNKSWFSSINNVDHQFHLDINKASFGLESPLANDYHELPMSNPFHCSPLPPLPPIDNLPRDCSLGGNNHYFQIDNLPPPLSNPVPVRFDGYPPLSPVAYG